MAINVRAPLETKMFNESGMMSRAWQEFFGTLGNKLNTGLSGIATIVPVSAVSNVDSVDIPNIADGTDMVDINDLNDQLFLLATQINAIVATLNDFRDKLVASNLMTE